LGDEKPSDRASSRIYTLDVSLSVWLGLVAAGFLISFTPGAGAINTMANSLTAGWGRSLWGIVGQQVALVIHIAIVAAGVGVLVASSPVLFTAIRYAGAAYLVYLGIRQWRSRAHHDPEAPIGPPESPWSMARRGMLVNLTNPKAIVFFLAFTPQFIRPTQPLVPQYVVLTATVVVIDVIVMWFFFAAAAKGLRRLTRSTKGQTRLNRLFGGLFVGVGALLAAVH
jgi:homoserine/homoserine lactone efflux protein